MDSFVLIQLQLMEFKSLISLELLTFFSSIQAMDKSCDGLNTWCMFRILLSPSVNIVNDDVKTL